MITWIIKNEEEAKRAFRKLFINLFENSVVFEDEHFYNKSAERTCFFREAFKIPNEIIYDVDAINYITENIKKIMNYKNLKFPFIVLIPNYNQINYFDMYNIEEDFKFEHEHNDISLEFLEKCFNENNVSIEFNECGTSVPICFEDLKKILNKYLNKKIKKTGSKIYVSFYEFNFTLYLKKREMNNA